MSYRRNPVERGCIHAEAFGSQLTVEEGQVPIIVLVTTAMAENTVRRDGVDTSAGSKWLIPQGETLFRPVNGPSKASVQSLGLPSVH